MGGAGCCVPLGEPPNGAAIEGAVYPVTVAMTLGSTPPPVRGAAPWPMPNSRWMPGAAYARAPEATPLSSEFCRLWPVAKLPTVAPMPVPIGLAKLPKSPTAGILGISAPPAAVKPPNAAPLRISSPFNPELAAPVSAPKASWAGRDAANAPEVMPNRAGPTPGMAIIANGSTVPATLAISPSVLLFVFSLATVVYAPDGSAVWMSYDALRPSVSVRFCPISTALRAAS